MRSLPECQRPCAVAAVAARAWHSSGSCNSGRAPPPAPTMPAPPAPASRPWARGAREDARPASFRGRHELDHDAPLGVVLLGGADDGTSSLRPDDVGPFA